MIYAHAFFLAACAGAAAFHAHQRCWVCAGCFAMVATANAWCFRSVLLGTGAL